MFYHHCIGTFLSFILFAIGIASSPIFTATVITLVSALVLSPHNFRSIAASYLSSVACQISHWHNSCNYLIGIIASSSVNLNDTLITLIGTNISFVHHHSWFPFYHQPHFKSVFLLHRLIFYFHSHCGWYQGHHTYLMDFHTQLQKNPSSSINILNYFL